MIRREIHPDVSIFKSRKKRPNTSILNIYNFIYGSDISQAIEGNFLSIIPSVHQSALSQEYQLYEIYTGETSSSGEQYLISYIIYSYDQSSSSESQILTFQVFSYDQSLSIESQTITSKIFSHDSVLGTSPHGYLTRVRTTELARGRDVGFVIDVTPFLQHPCVLILSGPSPPDTINGAVTGTVGIPIGPFSVRPTFPFKGIVYLDDSSTDLPNATKLFLLSTGSFDPPFLMFTGSIDAQQFYYTPESMGLRPISISSPEALGVSAPVFIFANPD